MKSKITLFGEDKEDNAILRVVMDTLGIREGNTIHGGIGHAFFELVELARTPGSLLREKVQALLRPRKTVSRAAYSPDGQKALVQQYLEDKKRGLLTDDDYSEIPRDRRLTQEEWASKNGIDARTLRRYLRKWEDKIEQELS